MNTDQHDDEWLAVERRYHQKLMAKYGPAAVTLLQPAAPLRRGEWYREMLDRLKRGAGARCRKLADKSIDDVLWWLLRWVSSVVVTAIAAMQLPWR